MYRDAERSQGRNQNRNQNKKRLPVARSTFMRAEEIDRERAMSGWNPYYGEEEPVPDAAARRKIPQEQETYVQTGSAECVPAERGERAQAENAGRVPMQPYFMRPDYTQVLEEQKKAERDLRMLQSMYPEAAKAVLPYIEDVCDQMEYAGSTMYDEYPDPTTILRLEQRIYNQVKDTLVQTEQHVQSHEEMQSMQLGGPNPGGGMPGSMGGNPNSGGMMGNMGGNPNPSGGMPGNPGQGNPNAGGNWLQNMIRILLLQEMYHRRCRRRGCSREGL